MNEKEFTKHAIKTLRKYKSEEDCFLKVGAERDHEFGMAVENAIEALCQQLPHEPLRSPKPRYGMGYEHYDWVCPSCGKWLAPAYSDINTNMKYAHHCSCGQAIDWAATVCDK